MKLRPGVRLERPSGGRCRLFDTRSGGVFAVNHVGDVILGWVESGATIVEMRAALVERFDVTARVAASDLKRFFEILHQHGLVEE